MKKLVTLLILLSLLFSFSACGGSTEGTPSDGLNTPQGSKEVQTEEPVTEEPVTEKPIAEENGAYKVGDIVDFGSYKWRVLDTQDNKVLLLTDEIIALDYFDITQETRDAIDSVAAKYPDLYNRPSDYEGWNVFADDDIFSEGDSYYDNWKNLLEKSPDSELIDPYNWDSVSWADCSLRNKLNSEMLFSDEEWAQILETEAIDPAGNREATHDKVFLLSTEQVEHYFPRAKDRGAKGTGVSDEMILRYLKDLHVIGGITGRLAEYALDLPNGGEFYWWAIGDEFSGVHIGTEEQLYVLAPANPIAGVRPAIWVSTET